MVERQPSKLRVAGSNPVSRSAHVAQLAEHILGKDEVTGPIPVMGFREQHTAYRIQRCTYEIKFNIFDVVG